MAPPDDHSPPSDSNSGKRMWRTASQFSYVGIFFGVAVVLGWLGGRWIENRWGGAPWVSLVGVLLGVTTGFRELYRVAKSAQRGSRD